jgi:phosphomethylpyrimidine synthase
MEISQDVRDFAAAQGASEKEALEKGMEVKSVEFVKQVQRIITRHDIFPATLPFVIANG